jgi:hypothetical protein
MGVLAWLVVEVDAGGDQEHEDGRGDPVDDEAERWPPAGVGDMVVAVLPEVFESVAGEAEHQQPCRSGDGRRGTTTKSPATAASAATMLGRPSAMAKPM